MTKLLELRRGLARFIIKKRFGPLIYKVVNYLWHHAGSTLETINLNTKIPLATLVKIAHLLIGYELVKFQTTKHGRGHLSLDKDRILLMIRYPKYIELIKNQFGYEAGVIMGELLLRGFRTASEIVFKAADRKNVTLAKMKEKFMQLVRAKYIKSIEPMARDTSVTLYPVAADGTRLHMEPLPDDGFHWVVDLDKFHQEMRDNAIVLSVIDCIDEHARDLMKLLLQEMYRNTKPWATVSNPIQMFEIKDILEQQGRHLLVRSFNEYVAKLRNAGFIKEVATRSRRLLTNIDLVQIKLKDAFTRVAYKTIEDSIAVNCSDNAARIFSLLRLDPRMQLEELQLVLLISADECKQSIDMLQDQNYLSIQKVRSDGLFYSVAQASSIVAPVVNYAMINLGLVTKKTVDDIFIAFIKMWRKENDEKSFHPRLIQEVSPIRPQRRLEDMYQVSPIRPQRRLEDMYQVPPILRQQEFEDMYLNPPILPQQRIEDMYQDPSIQRSLRQQQVDLSQIASVITYPFQQREDLYRSAVRRIQNTTANQVPLNLSRQELQNNNRLYQVEHRVLPWEDPEIDRHMHQIEARILGREPEIDRHMYQIEDRILRRELEMHQIEDRILDREPELDRHMHQIEDRILGWEPEVDRHIHQAREMRRLRALENGNIYQAADIVTPLEQEIQDNIANQVPSIIRLPLQELEDMYQVADITTPWEEEIRRNVNKLMQGNSPAENKLDDDMFIMQTYSKYAIQL